MQIYNTSDTSVSNCKVCKLVLSNKLAKFCSYSCYWESLKVKTPWNKGKKMSMEYKKRLSLSHIGLKHNGLFQKGHTLNVGTIQSEETKKKIGGANRGRKLWSDKQKKEIGLRRKGINLSEEHRRKISNTLKGRLPKNYGKSFGGKKENHYNWKGGISPRVMNTIEYKNWRKAVFERDDYRCFDCGERGLELQADHIYQWALYPRLRFEINNGQSLCLDCHKKKTRFERVGIYEINHYATI